MESILQFMHEYIAMIYILVFAIFLGMEVIFNKKYFCFAYAYNLLRNFCTRSDDRMILPAIATARVATRLGGRPRAMPRAHAIARGHIARGYTHG